MTTLTDADPKARELDEAFAAAMSGPAKPRSEPVTPPEIDPEAPFGRDEQGQPIAKYGYRNDGTIRRTGAGRKSRDAPDRARVDEHPAAAVAGQAEQDDGGYTAGLVGTAQGAWLCLTAASKLPLGRLRVGRYGLPADAGPRMAAQAYLLDQSKVQLAMALNTAAQHNARARAWARKLASEDATWMLTVASLAGPFTASSIELWKSAPGDGDQAQAQARAEAIGRMSAANEEIMETIKAQFELALAEAQLAAAAAVSGPGAAAPDSQLQPAGAAL
jgi:hypothetical protein